MNPKHTRGMAKMALELDAHTSYRVWYLSSSKNQDRLPYGSAGAFSGLHMKTMVVDAAVMLGASYNWTSHSENNMVEWLLVTRLDPIVGPTARMHEDLWLEGESLTAEEHIKLFNMCQGEGKGMPQLEHESLTTDAPHAGGSQLTALEDAGGLAPSDQLMAVRAELDLPAEPSRESDEQAGMALQIQELHRQLEELQAVRARESGSTVRSKPDKGEPQYSI